MIEICIAIFFAFLAGMEFKRLLEELKRRKQNKVQTRLGIDLWKDTRPR